MKTLKGKKVRIVSDNESYIDYLNQDLVITYASNKGKYYDSSIYPEMLCDLSTIDGETIPFALYEYEFKVID